MTSPSSTTRVSPTLAFFFYHQRLKSRFGDRLAFFSDLVTRVRTRREVRRLLSVIGNIYVADRSSVHPWNRLFGLAPRVWENKWDSREVAGGDVEEASFQDPAEVPLGNDLRLVRLVQYTNDKTWIAVCCWMWVIFSQTRRWGILRIVLERVLLVDVFTTSTLQLTSAEWCYPLTFLFKNRLYLLI
jgi:hypothetical protein